MTIDTSPEAVARMLIKLRKLEQSAKPYVISKADRLKTADMLEALAARVAELDVALETMSNLWAKEAAARQVAEGRAEAAEAQLAARNAETSLFQSFLRVLWMEGKISVHSADLLQDLFDLHCDRCKALRRPALQGETSEKA